MQKINRLKHALSKLNIAFVLFFTFTCTLIFLSGCAAPKQQVKQRFFFPPPPEEPKIEWLGKYSSQHDLPKTANQQFKESIMGRDAPRKFELPYGIASNSEGLVYVVDSQGGAVVVYDMNKMTVRDFGDPAESGTSPLGGLFKRPLDIDIDQTGNIYIADMNNHMVYVFSKDEQPLLGIGKGVLDKPTGIGTNSRLNRVYVTDVELHAVVAFDSTTGKHLFTIGKRGSADGEFKLPSDVAVAANDDVVVVDAANARVQIFDKDGVFKSKFGKRGDGPIDFQMPKGIAINREGHLFLTESRHNRVMIFNMEGKSLQTFGTTDNGGDVIGGFLLPRGIYVDKKERLYVVDGMNRKFDEFQIINEEWLKENPIKESEAAKTIQQMEEERKERKKEK